MGLRDRFKSLVKAQVRKRMGTFSVRSGPMPPPRSGADSAPAGPNDPVNFEPPKRREIVRVERLPDPVVDDALKPIDGVAIKARPSRDGED